MCVCVCVCVCEFEGTCNDAGEDKEVVNLIPLPIPLFLHPLPPPSLL